MPDRIVTACVVIIGNEILSGRTQDTNLAHIAQRLNEWGVRVEEARVIPDVEDVIVAAVNDARARFDYVFTTGGIGPTHDDITAECIAKAFGVPLVVSDEIARRIRQRPALEDVMENRLRMARIPEGATLVDNPTGGPQGFLMENVFVMAGIPSVMQAMLSTVGGEIEGGDIVRSRSVTAYLGESQIAAALADIQGRYPNVELGSYPFYRGERYGTTLVMRGTSVTDLASMLHEVKAAIITAGEQPVSDE
ncbi:MAG: molybdopterin-binding protein [Gammaproteobacteria bacterium]|nr:molybdopterin-binding protein [Gammaproteobacteria bacterium]MDE0453649.1 molybdopterin-binding protein [Gammaproteobacteria bacterium]